MSLKVIYTCSSLLWVEVAGRFLAENGWQPCYWVASSKLKEAIKKKFPQVVFHDVYAAIRGIRPDEFKDFKLAAIDEQILEELSPYEPIALSMMDRMDTGGTFTYAERLRLYQEQLRYWLTILEYYQPQVVIFPVSPHIVYDYILYILCKKKGVKTIMFTITVEGYLCPVERFEDKIEPLVSLYQKMLLENQEGDIKLSAAMEEYLKKVRSPYSVGIPFDTKEVIEEAKKNKTYNLSFFKRKFRAIFKYMGFFFMPAPLNYLKQKDKNFEYSKMSYLKFLKICKFDAEAKKRKLLTYYHKLAKSVSLERPYVYVPLHYQPEKTTSPDGGVFVNHQLMLDMLSKSIPSDWSIYVKEHIYQLNPYSLGERSRSFTFYDDILSLPNVKLVPLSVSPFDLMDNAKAIATVTGTSGLEALIRSRPVFIFGYVWYRGCEGAFYTPTLKDLKETIAKIEKGYQVDHQKVRTFMAALEQVCFRGYSDLLYKRVLDISEEDNITALAKAVQQTYYGKQNNKESVCSMTK